MLETVGQFGLQYSEQAQGTLGSLVATPSLFSQSDRVPEAGRRAIHTDGSLWYRGRVVVPQSTDLREEILREFHCSRFGVHPSGTKMYRDLRRQYY